MPNPEMRRRSASFELAANQEIERLQGELEATRRRREAAAAEFEAMLRAFDAPAAGRTDARMSVRSLREASEGARPGRAPLVPARTESPHSSRPAATPRRPGAARGRGLLVMGLALAAVAAVVFMIVPRGGARTPTETAIAVAPTAAGDDSTAAPVAPAAPAEAPPAAELTMERRVWVRITVDGERMIEREVAAGTRVPLVSGGTVVVRAGDGGAVRLWLRGEDQGVLGADGAVVTRTITIE
jgi:hypothetical protein